MAPVHVGGRCSRSFKITDVTTNRNLVTHILSRTVFHLSHRVRLLQTSRYQTIVTASSVSLVLVQQPIRLCGPRVHEETHFADLNHVQLPFEGINRTGIHCVLCETVLTMRKEVV